MIYFDHHRHDVTSLPVPFDRQRLAALVKDYLLAPAHQPVWRPNYDDSGMHRSQRLYAEHYIAYALLRGKPWDHSLATPSRTLMQGPQSMMRLRLRVISFLTYEMAKVILPDLATGDLDARLRALLLRDLADHCDKVLGITAWVHDQIPTDRAIRKHPIRAGVPIC